MDKVSAFLKKHFPGLAVWLVAFFVYSFTASPTVNFWDCGEYIASAAGLQVPHPPGAPLYLLLARVFSLVAPDEAMIAWSVNMLSVVASAFTVFFL
ncbi:MAG: protein O-mannosyl-transferase family, partial [Bacteroidota bacterium]